MSLWDKAKSELIDIVEWIDDSNDTLVWRFPRYQNEIKYGAKLVVRQAQQAVFVYKGQVADIFKSGTYTLLTNNVPVLSTIKGWKYGFNSPFKAEVYFVNTRNFTDLKWGTKNPVILKDFDFGPVRIRAFGSYVIRIKNPEIFIKEIVGTDSHFTVEEVSNHLRNLIVSRFADLLGESKIPILEVSSKYNDISKRMVDKIGQEFMEYGLEITKLLIENITLPPEVEEMLDKKSSMGIIGNLDKYAKFQSANAMEEAASNPAGDASSGIGMGMGFAMANQMNNMFNQKQNNLQQTSADVPPPLKQPSPVKYYVAKDGERTGPFNLNLIEKMISERSISNETYIWKKGMSDWEKACDVTDLKKYFDHLPPPIPKKI